MGTNGYVVIKDKSGTILMHPEGNQYGIDVIEAVMRCIRTRILSSLRP